MGKKFAPMHGNRRQRGSVGPSSRVLGAKTKEGGCPAKEIRSATCTQFGVRQLDLGKEGSRPTTRDGRETGYLAPARRGRRRLESSCRSPGWSPVRPSDDGHRGGVLRNFVGCDTMVSWLRSPE